MFEGTRVLALGIAALLTFAIGIVATPSGAIADDLGLSRTPTCTDFKNFGKDQWARKVPVAAGGNRNCVLNRGNANPGVKALQTALKACEGYRTLGKIDGDFGAKTYSSLLNFQKGFVRDSADGGYGRKTHNMIKFSDSVPPDSYYFCNRDSAI